MSENQDGRVAYYPGCALEGTARPYDASTKAVVKTLGLEMEEIEDWSCCGAMEVKNVGPALETYLSGRNLAIAQKEMNYDRVMSPCNGCYNNLKKAEHDVTTDPQKAETMKELAEKAGEPAYTGGVESLHLLEWLMEDVGLERIRQRSIQGLRGLKIANYYGCMYVRPAKIHPEKNQGPDTESTYDPHYMDDILDAAGAESVPFHHKTACCGGPHTLSDQETSTDLVTEILRGAEEAGAEVIATECPTCHSSLEMHMIRAEEETGFQTDIKIMYFTQLLGLAFGLKPRKLGVHINSTDPTELLRKKRIIR